MENWNDISYTRLCKCLGRELFSNPIDSDNTNALAVIKAIFVFKPELLTFLIEQIGVDDLDILAQTMFNNCLE